MKKVESSIFWQTTLVFTMLINLAILIWSIMRWLELKVIMWRSIWIIPLFFYLFTIAGCIFLVLLIQKAPSNSIFKKLDSFPGSMKSSVAIFVRVTASCVFTAILILIPYIKFSFRIGEVIKKSTQDPILTTIVFYWVVWWLILIATMSLKLAFKTNWAGGFASALILLGLAYEIFLRFQAVTSYPFSMGWSEASRYYYGSLYFAKSIYGLNVPLSTMHPTRYLLQSLPFLFSGLGLMANRFWQFFLWMSFTSISAFTLAWVSFKETSNSDINQKWGKFLFTSWIFLFFLRMGVYYYLEVMVFFPLLFVSAKHPQRSILAVIFASIWAGISRVNWFPVPTMIAIAIYFLEEPLFQKAGLSKSWKYFKLPMIWTIVGLIAAISAQTAYIPLSGNTNNLLAFVSSLSSPKLWDRLLPNDTYPLGIIPGILIVCGPLIIFLVSVTLKRYNMLAPLRWIGLWGMLIMLFTGGLIVSIKIGGGGDLHNMDSFAVLLAIITFYFIGGKVQAENGEKMESTLTWPLVATGLLIPLIFLIPQLTPMPKYHQENNQKAFITLRTLAEQASQKGPVLFINERHLLTFQQIDVPLVSDYEAVTLMEMAMSDNQPYLQKFYSDLGKHRFAAIVVGKQNVGIKDEGAFADENNIWNLRVSPYILCYYEPLLQLNSSEPLTYIEADQSRIEFYIPRTTPGTCP